MDRRFASPVQGRLGRALLLLHLWRRSDHHISLDAGGVMTIGQGGGAIGWRNGGQSLMRLKNSARGLHSGLKAGGADAHGGLGVSEQFVGCGQVLLSPQSSAPFETLTVFKFLYACKMFCDCRGELFTPPMGGLKLLPKMRAFGGEALRQLSLLVAVKQHSLQALAQILILQLKALDPRLQRGLFQTLFVEGLAQLLLGGDQRIE